MHRSLRCNTRPFWCRGRPSRHETTCARWQFPRCRRASPNQPLWATANRLTASNQWEIRRSIQPPGAGRSLHHLQSHCDCGICTRRPRLALRSTPRLRKRSPNLPRHEIETSEPEWWQQQPTDHEPHQFRLVRPPGNNSRAQAIRRRWR